MARKVRRKADYTLWIGIILLIIGIAYLGKDWWNLTGLPDLLALLVFLYGLKLTIKSLS